MKLKSLYTFFPSFPLRHIPKNGHISHRASVALFIANYLARSGFAFEEH